MKYNPAANTKLCSKCKIEKHLSCFSGNVTESDGFSHSCKDCTNVRNHKYYKRHKKKLIKKQIIRDKSLNGRYSACKYTAKRKGVAFCLTKMQFEQLTSRTCYYCDNFSTGHEYCGIDRINNDVGYIMDNCVSCCFRCNDIKSNYSLIELKECLEILKEIIKKLKLKEMGIL